MTKEQQEKEDIKFFYMKEIEYLHKLLEEKDKKIMKLKREKR